MTHAGPLPGVRPTAARSLGVPGAYSGRVERLDPLGVSVDALSGPSQVVPNVAQVPGLSLEVGDAVWVMCVNGDRRQLLVFAVQASLLRSLPAAVSATLAAVGAVDASASILAEETWTGADGASWPAAWAVTTPNGAATVQGGRGELLPGTGSLLVGPSARRIMADVADCEVLVDVQGVGTAAVQYIKIALRTPSGTLTSAGNPTDGYLVEINPNAGNYTLIRCRTSATATLFTGGSYDGNGATRLRFRAVGAYVAVKLWNTSGTEPDGWDYHAVDTNPYSTAGKVLLANVNGSSGVARAAHFDNLTVRVVAGGMLAATATLTATKTIT